MSGKTNNGDIYAVVDKAKKKKVLESQTSDSALPRYDVVDNSKKSNAISEMSSYNVITREVTSKNQLDASEGETYSKIDICPDNNFTYSTRNQNTKETARKKKIAGLVILVVALVLVVSALLLCVIIALAQNSSLKSEISLLQSVQPVNITSHTLDYLVEKISQLENNTQQLKNILGPIGGYQNHPASSCGAILRAIPSFPSGYYWVRSTNGSAVRVYCDMTRSCGGITGGWMRMADLNMSITSSVCPSGLMLKSNLRSCVPTLSNAICSSTHYPSNNEYSRVCGTVRGDQFRGLDGFISYNNEIPRMPNTSAIDDNYVDGVSLTHGMNPRQHIWTFAASWECNCLEKPTFVANDYFCDGYGSTSCSSHCNGMVLWDGSHCDNTPSNTWFYKQLPQTTTDDIEMRVCRDEDSNNEDVAIEIVELYIQ